MTPIVFLHIPKTAGQTVHNEIAQQLPAGAVSPVRVHTQSVEGLQYPEGFSFYSGHLDWPEPARFDEKAFMFTILRDPRERIASFYFYLLKEAEKLPGSELAKPQHTGKRMVLTHSADDYFFGGSKMWQLFIRDHYDNVYCRYFASGKLRGYGPTMNLSATQLLRQAEAGCSRLDKVYHLSDLSPLEHDLSSLFDIDTKLVGNYHNAGRLPQSKSRWTMLLDHFETDRARRRIKSFATLDEAFMDRMELSKVA
ncbi:sulfotransferase family 2 domain-containing protein [Actibacterium pelagium]|uniref:Sulfotransferase family protein n=1 Tax=Actibacterium pelagium TaxID=2029103 RepID=A0A917EJZ3_9RHOB|nr:sulfotransferase family 2 domain-containing protein [Actibacterium pelagium]GGE54931.1 hypothetical protein GCM10011517_23250 [Actibacterium pelagium]